MRAFFQRDESGPIQLADLNAFYARGVLSEAEIETRPGGVAALAFVRTKTAPKTRETYLRNLRRWISWCDVRGISALDVSEYHFDLFLAEVKEAGLSASSVKNLQSTVIGFYGYLVARHAVDRSPIPPDWRIPYRPSIRLDDFLNAEQISRLVATADGDRPDVACVVRLVTDAYMRLNELCDLQVDQVQFVEGGARIIGLTSPGSIAEEREVGPETAARLRACIGERENGPALLNRYGNPHNQQTVQRVLSRTAKRAGIAQHVNHGLLRNSAIAVLLGSGVAPLRFGLSTQDRKLRPILMREYFDALGTSTGATREVDPIAFVSELLAIASALAREQGAQPVAPIVLTGTALEFFLKRFARAVGSDKVGRGIEVWATSLRSLGAITKDEKKLIDVWAEWRNMAVHDDSTRLTLTNAEHMVQQVGEFVARHGDRLSPGHLPQQALFGDLP